MTYDEILKGLRTCTAINSSCEDCPYDDPADALCECANRVSNDAADAIESLQQMLRASEEARSDLARQLSAARKQVDELTKAGLIATDKANQAIAEKDVALSDLKAAAIGEDVCTLCEHCCAGGKPLYQPEEQYMEYCNGCDNDYSNFKWRGPQKEA